MAARKRIKDAFNKPAAQGRRKRAPALPPADDIHLLERRILFSNAARNGVMDTFRRMPMEEQMSVLDWQNGTGVTPLMNACRNGHEEAAAHLLSLQADVTLRDENGWSALTHAAARGAAGIVRLLLDAGADIDAQDKEQWTPLMAAAGSRRVDVATLLLERGCRTDVRGVDGLDASEIASDDQCHAIVSLIAEANAARRLKSEVGGVTDGLPSEMRITPPVRLKKAPQG